MARGRIDVTFADPAAQRTASGVLRIPVDDGDDDVLTLQNPTDGNVSSLRHVLRELDEAAVDVIDLSIHTPDLDDVFLALTGREARSEEPSTEEAYS